MIGRMAALILLSTLCLIQTAAVSDQPSLTVLQRGDNFTLTCASVEDEAKLFNWYKLKFGYIIQTIAAGSFDTVELQGQFDNSRFTATKVDTQYVLNIRNVSKDDEAMYFCQRGSAYKMNFINSTLLAVKDNQNMWKYVKQSPDTESVQPGDSVTLQCSLLSKNKENTDQCPLKQQVFWFRSGSVESLPSIIYTHSDEQEKRSCDYSLFKTIQSSSDTGTYYCAVATCGEILFGGGTKVETRQQLSTSLFVLGTLLICCVIVITALIISRNHKPVWEHCKRQASNHGPHDRSAEDQPSNVDEAIALNYVTLEFPSRNAKRWKNNRELPQDCLYSGMSQ